jgi:hypothetical protein
VSRPLRFPNPGSDLRRLVQTFRIIAASAEEANFDSFDLDFMTHALVLQGQASSRGAVGHEALNRSREIDRSRDPLYNQLKMYSELFRMFGWIRPFQGRRLTFYVTVLGEAVAAAGMNDSKTSNLLQETLLSVVFPNPNTDNLGVLATRPFRWMMLLASTLDGMISRNELIFGLIAVTDDQQPGAFEGAVHGIHGFRGSHSKISIEMNQLASKFGIQLNTLANYTRLPVAVLKDPFLAWGTKSRMRMPNGEIHEYVTLSETGQRVAADLRKRIDVRDSHLERANASLEERAAFAELTHIAMMQRVGFDVTSFAQLQQRATNAAAPLMNALGNPKTIDLLYSPFQQAADDVIAFATKEYSE